MTRKYLILPISEVTKEDEAISSTLSVETYKEDNNPPVVTVNSKIEVSGGTSDLTEHSSWSSFTKTLQYNVDNTKTYIKWEGDTPSFVSNLTGTSVLYTHTEMLEILNGSEWADV